MALFFGHALPYMAAHNNGNLYADLVPADERVEAVSGTQELAGGCLDGRVVDLRTQVLEQLNTNLLFNSSMAGATGSVLPTNWASGSVSGLTYTISSASTVQGFRSIEWTVSGTALSDGDLWLACEPMVSGSVVAQIPSEYVGSMYCAKVSGTIKAGMVLQTLTQNFVDGAVQETKTKDLAAVTGTTFVRIEPNSVKTDIDLENRVNLRLYQSIASGEVIDFTIRVAAPQVEAGFVASPFISTVSGAVSEVRGRPSILVVPQLTKSGVVYPQLPTVSGADFTFTRATTATRVNASGLIESVASGLLRLDYPIGGGCPAALIEPAATNLALYSEEFNDAYWTKTVTTISANVAIAPDGTTTADLLTPDSTGSNRIIQRGFSATLTSGTVYTQSFFVKSSGFQWVAVDGINGLAGAWFDLINGVIGNIASGNTASIQSLGNGWYRCSVTRTATSTTGFVVLRLADANNSTTATESGSNGVLIWGAQMETGAIPTSYIPTTTGSATRNADVCSVSGVSGYIGQTEGTIYAEVDYKSIATTKSIIAINDGTSNNRIQVRFASTTVFNLRIVIGGVDNDYNVTISPALSASGSFKVALAYKQNDYVLAVNGSLYASTASRNVPACTNLILGNSGFTSEFLNDRIRAAALYTTRLSNEQLESITRLT